MTLADHALAFALAVALPVYFLAITPATRRAIEAGESGRRVRDYRHTLFELWLQGLAVVGLWLFAGREWWELGLWQPGGWRFWLLALLCTGSLAVGVLQFRAVRDSEPTRLQLRQRISHLAYLLPHTRRELRWFSAVSVSAGVCEEIAYRGFLIWYFLGYADILGAWAGSGTVAAIGLSSVAFGFAHLYLGWRDAVRSALTGVVLAGIYLFSGTLWLAMAFHALIDINSGFLGWLSLVDREVSSEGCEG